MRWPKIYHDRQLGISVNLPYKKSSMTDIRSTGRAGQAGKAIDSVLSSESMRSESLVQENGARAREDSLGS